MKVLVLSGISPSTNNRTGGIFVTRRCKQLSKYLIYELYSIAYVDSFLFLVIKKIFNRGYISNRQSYLEIEGVRWNFINWKNNLIYYILKKVNPKYVIQKQFELLERKVQIAEFDLIHIHWAFPEGYIGLLIKEKYNVPFILTVHGTDIHTNPNKSKKVKKLTLEALENADRVIFVSNKLLNDALSLGYSGKNAQVIYNGVDTKEFTILDKSMIKNKLKIRNKIVGFIGYLNYIKGADRLPRIFNSIHIKHPNVTFLMIGDGSLKRKIQNECKRMNLNVIFKGMVNPEDVPYYLNAMDVMILPSRNEGFGEVVIEAHSCGIPVIAAYTGGIPEAIGNTDYMVIEGDSLEEKFAEKVVKILNMGIDKMQLRQRVQMYDWDNTVHKEYELYNSLVNR